MLLNNGLGKNNFFREKQRTTTMIRGLLPVKLVNVGDSVSNIFVSFLGLLNLFSSITEGKKYTIWFFSLKIFHLNYQDNKVLTSVLEVKNENLMYVCGMVPAGLSTTDLSVTDGQPRFFKTMQHNKENITKAYVLNPKSLEQKP